MIKFCSFFFFLCFAPLKKKKFLIYIAPIFVFMSDSNIHKVLWSPQWEIVGWVLLLKLTISIFLLIKKFGVLGIKKKKMDSMFAWNSSEDFLAWSKKSDGIKQSFSLHKSTPVIPKVKLPLLLRMVVWQVKFEVNAIHIAYIDYFTILFH